MELKKKLGKRIQELRIKSGLKQSELAEKVGIATKHQSCIETGKNYPSAELVERYAAAFNVDVSELMNFRHFKSTSEMIDEINQNLKTASDDEIKTAYRVFNVIFK